MFEVMLLMFACFVAGLWVAKSAMDGAVADARQDRDRIMALVEGSRFQFEFCGYEYELPGARMFSGLFNRGRAGVLKYKIRADSSQFSVERAS